MSMRRWMALPLMVPVLGLSAQEITRRPESARAPRLTPAAVAPALAAPAPVPFGPGEVATYKLKAGIFGAGEGRLAVAAVEDVRGRPAYRFEMDLTGGVPGFRIDDVFRSWMDVSTISSLRFMRDIHEGGYDPPPRTFEIFSEERRWERSDGAEDGETLSELPLDDVSFIYFLRQLPRLEVGDEYTFDRYFKEDGNPVRVKVVRRERKKVPAGTFDTVVLQPIIRTDGIFREGGKAEIYLTDDAERHVVYLSTRIPKLPFGNITMHLTSLERGRPLVR